ncbi:MAG: tetratricopeptide repeat protein, partial [Octadecabacter sp.]
MLTSLATLTACGQGAFAPTDGDRVFAPGVSGSSDIDGLEIGHRLMAAGEYDLALLAYTRAAGQQGLNVDTLSALGSANLKLGRLGQAETLLRRAVDEDPAFAAAWNNLGVIYKDMDNLPRA